MVPQKAPCVLGLLVDGFGFKSLVVFLLPVRTSSISLRDFKYQSVPFYFFFLFGRFAWLYAWECLSVRTCVCVCVCARARVHVLVRAHACVCVWLLHHEKAQPEHFQSELNSQKFDNNNSNNCFSKYVERNNIQQQTDQTKNNNKEEEKEEDRTPDFDFLRRCWQTVQHCQVHHTLKKKNLPTKDSSLSENQFGNSIPQKTQRC